MKLNIPERRIYFINNQRFKLYITFYTLRWRGLRTCTLLGWYVDFAKPKDVGPIAIPGYVIIEPFLLDIGFRGAYYWKKHE